MDYGNLKESILSGKTLVNLKYLPAQSIMFSILFHNKYLAQTVIRAVTNEPVNIKDPLAEHRNDLIKAMDSHIWEDVFTKDENNRIYTLDMQRQYLKSRNRNRNVYYSAKELSGQKIKQGKYENLKQVSITFIYENNTTPEAPPMAKIQLTDINTHEIYTDLLTLYEVNLNRITKDSPIHPDLIILKYFLTIKTQEDLCDFVTEYNTEFSRQLVICYLNAAIDEPTLIKVEGSKRFMSKTDFESLTRAHLEGKAEGVAEGEARGEARGEAQGLSISAKIIQALKANVPIKEIETEYNVSAGQIEELRQALAT